MARLLRIALFSMLALVLFSCASPRVMSELQQGKRFFDEGFYKRSMHELLPLACEGNPQAMYAIGYMYYYGLGVAQDTDVGYFWIKRSADRNYPPAIQALEMITIPPSYKNYSKR